MKVVLLEDIARLGNKYDVKDVADGFARNFLLPCKKAAIASRDILANIEKRRQEHEKERALRKQLFQELSVKLGDKAKVTISANINEKGGLFAAIDAAHISDAIQKQLDVTVPPSLISIPNPIKKQGEHHISIGEGDDTKDIAVYVTPTK